MSPYIIHFQYLQPWVLTHYSQLSITLVSLAHLWCYMDMWCTPWNPRHVHQPLAYPFFFLVLLIHIKNLIHWLVFPTIFLIKPCFRQVKLENTNPLQCRHLVGNFISPQGVTIFFYLRGVPPWIFKNLVYKFLPILIYLVAIIVWDLFFEGYWHLWSSFQCLLPFPSRHFQFITPINLPNIV